MKTKTSDHLKLGLSALGAVLFQYLFWDEHLGMNLFLYTCFITGLLPVLYPHLRASKSFLLVATGTLVAALMMLLHNSLTSKIAVFCSFLVMLGYANQPQLRLVYNAAATGLVNLAQGVRVFFGQLLLIGIKPGELHRVWYYTRLVVLPFVVLVVFHTLFSVANERYYNSAISVANAIVKVVDYVFSDLNIGRLMLLLLGLLITAGALYIVPVRQLLEQEENKTDMLFRHKPAHRQAGNLHKAYQYQSPKMLGLRKEYLSALVLLVLVNALLLVVNAIDINWIWFGFVPAQDMVLSQFVHEGTYVLIFSIMLAMGILLYFFRGNLNFYQGNKWLRYMAFAWVVQNAVLAISVGLRNYHYIHHCGLAYKRIGVVVFLLITLCGLCTIFIKIRDTRTVFYLLRTNALAVYIMLIALTFVNWDPLIARVNIKHPNTSKIDYDFLVNLSGKALPVLLINEVRLPGPDIQEQGYPGRHRQHLYSRIEWFIAEYEANSWRSWNKADSDAYRFLKFNFDPVNNPVTILKKWPEPQAHIVEPPANSAHFKTSPH